MDPKNPFFILRLPANATAAQIKRAGQMALAQARLEDTNATVKSERVVDVERALENLRDPIQRLKHGVEWPSLGAEGATILREHPRFAEVAGNPTLNCEAEVEELVALESAHDRSHAKAVFKFLRASALFRWTAEVRESKADDKRSALSTATRLLTEGMQLWTAATGAREFWLERRLAAKELGDPRIDAALLKRLQEDGIALPVTRFASAASDALRARDVAACREIVSALRTCRCPPAQIDDALSSIYAPMCARAASAIAELAAALKTLKSKKSNDYKALLKRYKREVGLDVQLILEVGDLPGSSEEMIRDKASEFLRKLAIAAANEADAYDVSTEALGIAHRAANSPALQALVAGDQKAVRGLVQEKHLEPYFLALNTAIDRTDFRAALSAIDELIARSAPDAVGPLRENRRHFTTALATKLFNQAMECLESRNLADARRLFEEAREVEQEPKELLIIDRALVQLAQVEAQAYAGSKSGCLIPLVIAGALFALGMSGALIGGLQFMRSVLAVAGGFMGGAQ